MTVVWVSHRSGLAGAEVALVEAVEALRPLDVEITAVLPWDGPLRDRLVEAGAAVEIVPHARWVHAPGARGAVRRAARNAVAAAAVARLVRRSRAEAVVTNTLTIPTGALAARLAGRPHLWYVHEFGRRDHGIRFDLGDRASLGAIRRLSRLVLVNSRAVAEEMAAAGVHDPRVVQYAVDVPDLPGHRRAGALRLVQLATLAPHKRQSDAVRAMGVLHARGVDARLRLVGPDLGGHETTLRRLAEDAGVTNRVELTGFTSDPAGELARSDIALTCSQDEAFGRATVEAMKLGRPVVASRSGANPELVRHGWNGLLYRTGDHEGLASQLQRLAGDPGLCSTLGANARTWASARFTRERYGAELAAALAEARA